MEWVRSKGFTTVCIFLTCHSKFEYASRAISLQIFEYLLKPVSYEQMAVTITQAKLKVTTNQERLAHRTQAGYWNQEKMSLLREFWNQLLHEHMQGDEIKLTRLLKARHLGEDHAAQDYQLALITFAANADYSGWGKSLFGYAVENILMELLEYPHILKEPDGSFLVIYRTDENNSGKPLVELVETLGKVLPATFFVYYADSCKMYDAATVY